MTSSETVYGLVLTPSRRLIAATSKGLFLLDLSAEPPRVYLPEDRAEEAARWEEMEQPTCVIRTLLLWLGDSCPEMEDFP